MAAEYTDCIFAEGLDSPNECPAYDIKQSDCEASVILELWGMRSTPLFPSIPGQLWPVVEVPDRCMSKIEQFDILTVYSC